MRVVSIHQPGYLPWLGYFERIALSDVHVVLDDVQFEKNWYQNRNRIRSDNDGGWQWLTVPVKHGLRPINEVEVSNERPWTRKHVGALQQSYGKSPFFDHDEWQELLGWPWNKLCPLLTLTTWHLRTHLDVLTPTVSSSTLRGGRELGQKSNLVLELCKLAGADVYLAGPHARGYLDEASFRREGIQVRLHQFETTQWPPLSAVDALFRFGPAARDRIRRA